MKTGLFYAPKVLVPLALTLVGVAHSQTLLPQVQVRATRFAESAATLPLGVSVITADEIAASGADSVNTAIMKLLGVAARLDTSGGNNYTLDLRGFGATADSNQVVIVDGLRLNEADLSSAALAAIAIESVQRIEVLRGNGAVLYGEGATGGVIVVTTKAASGIQRKSSAQLYAAAGNQARQDLRLGAVLAGGGFALDVSADERRGHGHRDNFSANADGLSAALQWSNDWFRLGVRGSRNTMRSGLPGPLSAAQYSANPAQASSLTDFGENRTDSTGLFVEASLGDWQIAADAAQRGKRYDSVSFGSPYGYDVNASNHSLRAKHEGRFAALSNALVLGVDQGQWDRNITKSAFTPVGTTAHAQSSAWYLKNDITLAATATRLSMGWRTEDMKKTESLSATSLSESHRAWEFGVSQPLGINWVAYARVGQSFRIGNVDEFSFTNPAVALKAQTARDTEMGARWTVAPAQFEARWYRSDLDNEIGYDPAGAGPFGPFGANVNFDPTYRQGLELEARHSVTSAFDVRLNAAWRQARFKTGAYANKDVPLVAGRTLALRGGWRPAPGHALDAGVVWVASQNADFANTCQLPAYATADLRYAYQWGRAELALGVANLTDQKYYTLAFGCVAAVTTAIYPEAGRSVTASLRVSF